MTGQKTSTRTRSSDGVSGIDTRKSRAISLALCTSALLILVARDAEAQAGRFVRVTNQLGPRVNSSGSEGAPSFSGDGRALVFGAKDRSGGAGDWDLFMATRADPSGPFTEVSRFDDGIVNTAGGEAWGTITSDRKTLIFARSPARQGSGDLLWIATRPRSVGPFDDSRPLDEINVGFTKIVGQRLSPDGGTLLFTARSPVDGNYDIWVSLRSENNEFSRPVRLEEQFVGSQVNSPSYHEHSPSMSSDSLTLFFSDTWLEPLRPGGSGVADIWMSTRSSPDSAFESVVNLRELSLAPVNSGTYDLQPCISPNWPERGSELVFVSTRSGSMDLWIATWEPAGEAFLRGDCNSDGRADLSDAVCILDSLFRGITAPGCHASANANGDESVNISDPTFLLNHLFLGGPAPVAPFPDCGPSDLETDAALGCVESSCP